MHIGEEGIENLFMNMMLQKKTYNRTSIQRHFSCPPYLGTS
jgi:hypothetical protein